MRGERLFDGLWLHQANGTYWRDDRGIWMGTTPNGLLCSLARHQVTEHDDGSITVSPSILVTDSQKTWHGFLERGIWREV